MEFNIRKILTLIMLVVFYCLLSATYGNSQDNIAPGSKVVIRNNHGNITIIGWEHNTIDAVATSGTRTEKVPIRSEKSSIPHIITIIVNRDESSLRGKIHLQVKLPRNVDLEPISTAADNITASDINGLLVLKTESGEITISRVGSVNAQTKNGEISAEAVVGEFTAKSGSGNIKIAEAQGPVDITTTNGNVDIGRINGPVKIVAINGKIAVRCVRGDIEIRDTSSQIRLLGVSGDMDVSTSNGKADFIGHVESTKRYRLKTLSGAVSMLISDKVGYTAVLSSYSGPVETDFELQPGSRLSGKTDRRGVVRLGNGEARIEMDSFDGRVRLGKIISSAIENCEQ